MNSFWHLVLKTSLMFIQAGALAEVRRSGAQENVLEGMTMMKTPCKTLKSSSFWMTHLGNLKSEQVLKKECLSPP